MKERKQYTVSPPISPHHTYKHTGIHILFLKHIRIWQHSVDVDLLPLNNPLE